MRFLRWDLQGLRRFDSNLVSEKSAHQSDFSLLSSCPQSGHKQERDEDALRAASKNASLVVRAFFSLFATSNRLLPKLPKIEFLKTAVRFLPLPLPQELPVLHHENMIRDMLHVGNNVR